MCPYSFVLMPGLCRMTATGVPAEMEKALPWQRL